VTGIGATTANGIATLRVEHGRVNAIRPEVVEDLERRLDELERDDAVRGVILTGTGPFFSFGFDVPHMLDFERDAFGRFLHAFTGLYTRLFLFPKPVVAAVNGHAVAGGWMLVQACDAIVVGAGNVKLGLNEVRFGAALFAGSMAILRHRAGGRTADLVAGSGAFFGPDEAVDLGLVDETCDRDALSARAGALLTHRYGGVALPAFAAIRRVVREPVVDGYRDLETPSIERFLDVWYAPGMRASLEQITIRG
jgi:enoyl-CoA hydratase